MLASSSSLSVSISSSPTAEAILSRARRLSSNAFERSHPPTSFSEGESSLTSSPHHHNSFDALLSSNRSSYTQKKRRSTTSTTITATATPESTAISAAAVEPLSVLTSTTSSTTDSTTTAAGLVIVQSPVEKETEKDDDESNNDDSRGGLNHSPDTFLDPNCAQSTLPPCATSLTGSTTPATSSSTTSTCASSSSTSALLSTTTMTRPRALTGGDAGINLNGKLTIDSTRDHHHRKHQSENGRSSLVYDILAVLRQQTDLESPSSVNLLAVHKNKDGDRYQADGGEQGTGTIMTPAGLNSPSLPSTLSPSSTTDLKKEHEDKSKETLEKDETTNGDGQTEYPQVKNGKGRTVDNTLGEENEKKERATIPDQRENLPSSSVHAHETGAQQQETQHDHEQRDTAIEQESTDSVATSQKTTAAITASPSLTPASTISKGGSFLKKMGVRKNSFNEATVASSPSQSPSQSQQQHQDNSDASSILSHTTQLSTTSSNSKLNKKRSSKKLLNKFVPKFLQTSFSPTTTAAPSSAGASTISTNSPQSSRITRGGEGGLASPVSSTRSSRSGSICSEGPGLVKNSSESLVVVEGPAAIALPPSAPSSTKGSSQEFLPLLKEAEKAKEAESREDTESAMTSVPAATHTQTSPEFLRSLRLDTGAIGAMARRFSNASTTKPEAIPKQGPVASAAAALPSTSYKVQVEYEEETIEDSEDEDEDNLEKEAPKRNRAAEQVKQMEEDPPLSPYIIDENCDDDFFLNSVLRKKSVQNLQQAQSNKPQPQNHHYHQPPQRYQSSSSIMSSSSSRASETTLHSMRSSPTLTGGWSSSQSSQPSTPSPTSPFSLNGQVYPFPTMSTAKSNAIGMSMKYQTMHRTNNNPLPPPIYAGQDQRRSRLRDAVGEWRRATNASD